MNIVSTLVNLKRAIALLSCIFCVVVGSPVFAQQNLDDELFSDLAPVKRDAAASNSQANPPSEIDRRLQQELGGDDIGQQRGENKMLQLAGAMKQVRNRIQRRDLAAETQEIQAGIVQDLGAIIDQLRKQKQQSKSGGGGSKQNKNQKQNPSQQSGSKPGQKPQQMPGGNKPGDRPSNKPAKDSSTQLGNAEAVETDSAVRDQMMQEAWGNLPAGIRQQMQSARPEKFLPKYSRLIEEYFKRLSEEEDR